VCEVIVYTWCLVVGAAACWFALRFSVWFLGVCLRGLARGLRGVWRVSPLSHDSRLYYAAEARRRREQQEAAERSAQAAQARRRRSEARAACDAFYSLHAPEIGRRFTRAMYDAFAGRYLGEEHSPEDVEEQARQLHAIMQQHLQKAALPEHKQALEEVAKKERADAELLKNQQEREAARAAVAAFYLDHSEMLLALYPPALLRSTIQTLIPDSCTAKKAWEGARQLIAELHTLTLQQEERRRQEARRPRRLTNPDDV
jgi:hypothetical protein